MTTDIDINQLRLVMLLCKEFNVKKVDLSGVSLEFGTHYDVVKPADLNKIKFGEENGNPTNDELLFWSAPNVDVNIHSEPPS